MDKEILKNIVVLYVEDEEDVRDFTARTLSNLVDKIVEAPNGLIGLELFTKYYENPDLPSFDIIITDINMPKMNGLEMLLEIQKIDSTIPTVITTAHNDANFLKQAIDLGVSGYAMKPMNLFQLLKSITSAVESRVLRKKLELHNKNLEKQIQDRTVALEETIFQLELNSQKLLHEATHDHLTNIFNRQKLNQELKDELLRAVRYNHDLSIIMFDIDHFKQINDTYGHDIGDEVLISISNLSQQYIRNVDTLARWGGEEFMILLPETTIDDAECVANKLKDAISQASLSTTKSLNITASFGLSALLENDTKDIFLKRVDDALYEAKNAGRNIVIKR